MNITTAQKNYISALIEEREVPQDFPVSIDSLEDLTTFDASKAINALKALPKKAGSVAAKMEAKVKALKPGNYRLSDGTVVKWSVNAKTGAIFAVIDGKPQWKKHYATGCRIVEEGKKMRSTKKATPVAV
jgi:hypothetical protein